MHELNSRLAAEGAALSLDRSSKSPTPDYFAPLDQMKAGKYLTIKRDLWRENYWATVVTEVPNKQAPPKQLGDRMTTHLSHRAKKKIENASLYTAAKGQGFRVFATLTLTPEWRAQLEKWDAMPRYSKDEDGKRIINPERKSLGGMVAEFINVMQQRHRNGLTLPAGLDAHGKIKRGGVGTFWTTDTGKSYPVDFTGKWQPLIEHKQPEKIAHRKKNGALFWFTQKGERYRVDYHGEWSEVRYTPKAFSFVWVIEMPTNDNGERNPHIHLMMNWSVKKHQFRRWARWIEATWGKGFVNLQKLRIPASASAYMAKAANYMGKGADGNQGEVRGNRYAVSRNATPPQAEWMGRYRVTDELREAMKSGKQIKDEGNTRKDIYFTEYAFGAKTKHAWGELCTTLKAYGHKFEKLNPNDIEYRPYQYARWIHQWLYYEQSEFDWQNGGTVTEENWAKDYGEFYMTVTTEKQYADQLSLYESTVQQSTYLNEYTEFTQFH